VIAAVDDRDLNAYHRIAAEDTVVERLFDALLGSGDVFLRDYSADYAVFPLKSLALFKRFDLKDDVSVLSLTSGLTDKFALCPGGSPYRLSVSDLRTPHLHFDVELPAEPVNYDLKVEFSHTAYQGLPCLLVD